jgi:DNA-binding transcriptional ArsR family regulator
LENEIRYISSLIGDPVRSNILWTLLDGRAYTATELAMSADTSPQNISMHLNKLLQAGLLTVQAQGRHRYYSFSKPEVAYAIEALGNLVPDKKHKIITSSPENTAITFCRTCYDHLAGKVGVLVTEALIRQKLIESQNAGYLVTKKGRRFFSDLEIDIDEVQKQRRIFAKPCLDWSERRHHLAGALGAGFFQSMLSLDYFRKKKNSRALILTSGGRAFLYNKLRISV